MKYILIGVILITLIVSGFILWSKWRDQGADNLDRSRTVTSGDQPLPGSQVRDLPIEPAAARARKDLAGRLKVDEKNISVVEVKAVSWPDACLSLPDEGEMCAQVITPGFWVVLSYEGDEYFYRTNKDGSALRLLTHKSSGCE